MFRNTLLHLISGDRGGYGTPRAEERYWDAFVRGATLPPDVIAPAVATVIRQVHTLDDAPLPDAAFAARLENELLRNQPGVVTPPSPILLGADASRNGPIAPAHASARSRRRVVDLTATAALLAIVLASVVIMLRFGSPASHDEDAFPLVLGPGITDETLLLQARFESFPEGWLSSSVERWVLQPGGEAEVGRGAYSGEGTYSGEGPSAILVEAGTLTIQSDGLIAVTRFGASTPVTLEAASEIELQTGDRGFAPNGVVSLWRNAGAIPVRLLEAKIRTNLTAFPGRGVLNYVVVEQSIPTPTRPVIMNVFQITLQPEAVLTADTISGLEMLKVEAGRLVAIDVDREGNALPPKLLGQGTRQLDSFPPGRAFRSGNDEPVTIANTNPLRPDA
ncbi:MAG: hypothetical protein M3Q50_12175 [Chloroflexota bacterium]|nr:hypothetical protein [Chloroflexota bacterium]